jgi:signal transduction histidine kinase
MISLASLSIPRKIVAIAMIITASALLIAGAGLISYDFFAARRDLRASTTVLAQIVAENTTAAVAFDDEAAVAETLNSLRAEPSIVAACVYKGRELFIGRTAGASCPGKEADAPSSAESIVGDGAILLQRQQIGTVRLIATMAPAYGRLRVAILVLTAVFAVSVLFAFALSARLHRFVSEPILSLAKTANTVSQRKDYSLRAIRQSNDELATLVDAFNEMLEHIEAREAELIQANRLKDEFLTTLSHELRTPLTPILGWTKLLLQRDFDPSRAKTALETIDRSAELQARLIEDLLDVARIMTGKLNMELTSVDLRQVIEAAVQSSVPVMRDKQLILESRLERVPLIQGNATRIQQVMWNLLSNSAKFTPAGGKVRVILRPAGDQVQLSVSDTGIGIQNDFLPYVFDRFRQADSSHTRRHGGLGLGLAIVKHVIEQHGGTVTVHSAGPNQGTTFVLVFPVPAAMPPWGIHRRDAEDAEERRDF